jgi:Lon protease-like protein
MDPTPMFPLGTTLLPGSGLPLHVFESRYRQMIVDILAVDGPPEFGQVLITHGHEAGGGDERSSVGTLARMADIQEIGEGRYAFVAVGIERIRVVEWLPDNPYPLARVEAWPDEEAADSGPPTADMIAAAVERVGRVLGLAARLSAREAADSPATPGIGVGADDDPSVASYRLAAIAPLGAADRYRLLAASGPSVRLAALDEVLDDVEAMLKFRLS